MGKPTGFMEYKREISKAQDPKKRHSSAPGTISSSAMWPYTALPGAKPISAASPENGSVSATPVPAQWWKVWGTMAVNT